MKPIAPIGYERPRATIAGPSPALRWLAISDLVIDPTYQRPVKARARKYVESIACSFSWSRFATVIVAPIEDGKFVIIDGQYRATAAALAGFEKVPCQIVAADREERAMAFEIINHTYASSRMAQQRARYAAKEPHAIKLVELCARAEVELLHYPVPVDRQRAGQTMAVGALTQCLNRHGEETLITALQCVTQTTNNRPGVLSARMIKAMCAVLGSDSTLRDSGLSLLEIFDDIDLMALSDKAAAEAPVRGVSPVQLLTDRIRSEVARKLVRKRSPISPADRLVGLLTERRLALLRQNKKQQSEMQQSKLAAQTKVALLPQKS